MQKVQLAGRSACASRIAAPISAAACLVDFRSAIWVRILFMRRRCKAITMVYKQRKKQFPRSSSPERTWRETMAKVESLIVEKSKDVSSKIQI